MWNRFIRLQIFQYYFFWNGLLSFFSLPPTEFVNSFFPAILKMDLEISTAAGWYRKICLMVCRQQTQAQCRKYSCRVNLSILGNFYQFLAILDNFFLYFLAIFGHFYIIAQGYLSNHIFDTVIRLLNLWGAWMNFTVIWDLYKEHKNWPKFPLIGQRFFLSAFWQ